MTEGDNADAKGSENQLEGEDSERTVNCLRGRLLAERTASRKARDEAKHLGNKLMKLEKLLKEESKSRNRAETKLKLLMKKLASINISHFLDKTDISSVSSSTATSTKEPEKSREPREIDKASRESADLSQNDLQNCLLKRVQDSCTTEGSSSSAFAANSPINADITGQSFPNATNSEKPRLQETDQMYNESAAADELSGDHVDDNPMALVTVDMRQEEISHTIDPEVLDDTVKEVLDTLRRAKEQLLSSMERRRTNMIKVG